MYVVVKDMPSRPTPAYSCSLTLHLVGPRSWTDVPATLAYEVTDPYAVRIAFGDVGQPAGASGEGITWMVGRELLRSGIDHPAGEGDIRIWPAHAATDLLFLHLRAPSGEALFELSRAAVAAFLRQTEALVPLGAESARLSLDAELSALLSGGGADSSGR